MFTIERKPSPRAEGARRPNSAEFELYLVDTNSIRYGSRAWLSL